MVDGVIKLCYPVLPQSKFREYEMHHHDGHDDDDADGSGGGHSLDGSAQQHFCSFSLARAGSEPLSRARVAKRHAMPN